MFRNLTLLAVVILIAPASWADDVTKANRILCTAIQATSCNEETDCVTDTPASFNVPQFIEIDLVAKLLSTTKAAEEQRQSPIRTLTREDGLIVVQGLELGRAYSLVINESTGRLSAGVARDGITVSVFGACTPLR